MWWARVNEIFDKEPKSERKQTLFFLVGVVCVLGVGRLGIEKFFDKESKSKSEKKILAGRIVVDWVSEFILQESKSEKKNLEGMGGWGGWMGG